MPSTYSDLKIQLMATGENSTTWGAITNDNFQYAVEQAIVGSVSIPFSDADVTIQLTNTNGSQSARNMRLNLTGTATAGYNLVLGSGCQINKPYVINNATDGTITVKNTTGTGIAVPAGKTMWVFNNGVNVVDVVTHLTSLTLGSPLPISSGGTGSNTGSGASLTNLNASSVSSGTLAVAYGGTGAATAAAARVSLLPSYTGNAGKLLALNAGATDTEWVSAGGAGTVTSVNATTAISGLSFSGGPITSAGTLTLSGTLGAAGGGTGLTTPGTAGNVLVSNGSAWISSASSGSGTVTSVSGTGSVNGLTLTGTVTTTGSLTLGGTLSGVSLTSQVTGTLPAGNGGTGITTPGTSGNVLTSNGSAWVSQAVTASGTFSANDGSVSAPSIYFTNDTNTGIYRTTGAFTTTVNGVRALYASDALGSSSLGDRAYGAYLGVDAGTGVNGQSCVAIGFGAIGTGFGASAGTSCTAVGYQALRATTGSTNTALGAAAGFTTTSGTNVTCLGATATASSATASNEITLGNSSVATLRCQVTTITSLSDARDKKDVVTLDAGLAFINALNPVRFTWDMRPEEDHEGNTVQGRKDDPDTGFIAQELKAAQEAMGITIPGLVYDNNPDKLEAGYGKLLPVLVKAIQELSAKVEALEAQLGG